jgi:dephospho-CoA kinase
VNRVFITGMSGTGKSTVIEELAARGLRAVDLDDPYWSELVSVPSDEPTGLEPGLDWVWREERVAALLAGNDGDFLFASGCSPNQGQFYDRFDRIVLLTAPASLIAERLSTRTNNAYGKRPDELERALALIPIIEPLLRQRASHVIDTSASLDFVIAAILDIAAVSQPP